MTTTQVIVMFIFFSIGQIIGTVAWTFISDWWKDKKKADRLKRDGR